MLGFFNGKTKTVTGAAIILALASFASRFIGIIRERIFAHYYGAGDLMDAYIAAFRFPDLLYMLMVMGALSASFIPVFSELWEKNRPKAWDLVNTVINLLAVLLVIIGVALIIFAPALADLVAPGFSPEKRELTVMLMRIMFVSPVLLGISSIVSGVLQTLKYFFIYALTPIFYNIGIIIGAVCIAPYTGPKGLAIGVIIGALLHLLAQLPALLHAGYQFRAFIDWKNRELREMIRLMLPRMLGLGAAQFNIIIMTTFASTLPIGAVSVFHYANNLQSFPIGIIGVSIAIAAFPAFCAFVAKGRIEELAQSINTTTRTILFLMLPITILFLLLRAQITRVILGTGAFDWQATIATGDTLAAFALSLFAQALLPVLQRAFYALHNTKTPLYAAIAGIIVNVVVAWWLKSDPVWGVAGIAIGFSAGVLVQVLILWVSLRHTIGSLHELTIVQSLYQMTAAMLVMALIVQKTKTWIGLWLGTETFWTVFTQLLVPASMGVLAYVLLLWYLKSPELQAFLESARRRLHREKPQMEELPDSSSVE